MNDAKVLFSSAKIQLKVKELAEQIKNDFPKEEIVLVCVLNGAYMFASDLSKALWNEGATTFEMDFVRISSYGTSRKSSKKPILTKDIESDIKGKVVIIVEDIIETGHTLKFLVEHLEKLGPRTIKICSLLSKPLREVSIEPDYLGFSVQPEDWVEGYGLDTGSLGRGRQDIIARL